MWRPRKVIGVGAVIAVIILGYSYYHVQQMTDLSQATYVRLYGEGIYEFHTLTGTWPARIDDLARTSLPQRYPHWWQAQLGIDADVIVCPKSLKAEPNENGHVIICYHNKGLDAERGRMWVCWGDLRTGWITSEELNEQLNKQKE